MTTLKFKTNVKCGGCVAKITPHLDQLKSMIKWSVDTTDESKILTVESTENYPDKIIEALKDAGYIADLIAVE